MNEQKYTDQELIELLASPMEGQHNMALNIIYRLYYKEVEKWVKHRKQIKNRVPDLFQEAVISLWKTAKRGTFKSQSILPFLITVCKNKWINELNKKHQITELDNNNTVILTLSETQQTVLEQEDCENYIAKMMNEVVKPNCVQLLQLFFYEGKRDKEIAETMNYNNSKTVKSLRNRCMKQLKNYFAERPKFKKLMQRFYIKE
jgi:RNA polymerase sigma factor (sigma-70 family)